MHPTIGHNGGPPLEQLEAIYPDVPQMQSISQWCAAQGIHRSQFYRLPDPPTVIVMGGRKGVPRLSHFEWLQRRLAEAEAAA